MVEKLISGFCCYARFSIKGKLCLLQFLAKKDFKCLFGLFSNRIISFLAQYEGCFYEKNCPRSNNKKDDYGVKKKSSNVTLS